MKLKQNKLTAIINPTKHKYKSDFKLSQKSLKTWKMEDKKCEKVVNQLGRNGDREEWKTVASQMGYGENPKIINK